MTRGIWLQLGNGSFAPDGQNYKAVYGTVKGIYSDVDTLGIKTNAKSTNWYLIIGNMIIAGCQIEYAVQTDACCAEPYRKEVDYERQTNVKHCMTRIYFADN